MHSCVLCLLCLLCCCLSTVCMYEHCLLCTPCMALAWMWMPHVLQGYPLLRRWLVYVICHCAVFGGCRTWQHGEHVQHDMQYDVCCSAALCTLVQQARRATAALAALCFLTCTHHSCRSPALGIHTEASRVVFGVSAGTALHSL